MSAGTGLVHRCRVEVGHLLRERWRECFPDRAGGSPPAVRQVGRVREHGYSVIQELAVDFRDGRPPANVIAKTRRAAHWGALDDGESGVRAGRLVEVEYRMLEDAFAYFHGLASPYRVVRPVAHLRETQSLVVEKADGTDLGRLVARGARDLVIPFRWVGAWLRRFHDGVHRQRVEAWDPARFEAALRARTGRLVARGVDAGSLDRVVGRAAAAARRLDGAEVPVSTLHGDMKLRHVFATASGIQVLDFGNTREGSCYEDVAAFLVEVKVLGLGRGLRRAVPSAALESAFLEGYLETEGFPPLVRLHVLAALLKKWERRLRRWSHRLPWPLVQAGLERVGAKSAVDRAWIDPWFCRALDQQLERLGRER